VTSSEEKLGQAEEGELRFSVFPDTERGIVCVHFGEPVDWIGLPPELARGLAVLLLREAHKLDGFRAKVELSKPREPEDEAGLALVREGERS